MRRAFVAVALVACTHPAALARAQSAPTDVAKTVDALERLLALDRDAAARLSALTRLRTNIWRVTPDVGRGANNNPDDVYKLRVGALVRDSGNLLGIEQQIDTLLEEQYVAAAKDLTIANRARLVRLAALHWHSQVRRYVQRSLHTSVPGLETDSRCKGDMLADQLILRYMRSVWGETPADLSNVTDALLAIAAQTACLGSEQSETLASGIASAFSDIEAFLRLHRLEWVVPHLAELLAQPLVLVYDVEKYRGLDSPLARWFAKYRQVLVDSVRLRRTPATWHGLWLYDRMTGRMVGYSLSNNPADENAVRLDEFYTSITSPENLGANDCSFSEMIQRGAGDNGYFCAGAACDLDRQSQTARAELQTNPTGAAALSTLGVIAATGGQGRLPADGFGAVCAATRDANAGSGGRLCPSGSPGAMSPMAQTLACISSQAVPPGTEVMACMMEATGYCSNPAERLTKDLRLTELTGVPLGKDCGLGDTNEQTSGVNQTSSRPMSPETRQQLEDALEQQRQAQTSYNLREADLDAAERASRAADAELQRAQADETTAREHLQKASQQSQDPQKAAEARQELSDAQQKVMEAQTKKNAADAAKTAAEAAKAAAEAKKGEADQKAKQALDKAKKEQEKKKEEPKLDPEKQARCDPDSPGCDLNRCTAMSESARQTLKCMKKAEAEATLPDFMARSLGCDPTNCDPELSTGGRPPRGGACLALLDPNAAQTAVNKQCGIVHCASGESAFLTSGGACGCGVPPAGSAGNQLENQCSALSYCEAGKAEYKNGACVCSSQLGPAGTISGPRDTSFIVIARTPTFLDVNPVPPPPTGVDPRRVPR